MDKSENHQKNPDVETDHVEFAKYDNYKDLALNAEDAKLEAEAEHNMTILECIRMYPKAILWTVGVSFMVIMDGYDTALLGAFYAFPVFNKKFGEQLPDGSYQVPAQWQTGLSMASACGGFLGIIMSGYLVERIGHRRVMLVCLATVSAFIFIIFFAPNRSVLLVGELLFGFPTGMISVLGPTYASEVVPTPVRHILTSWINACWVIGQLVSQGVLRGFTSMESEWAYKIPFAIQWAWPIPLAIIILLAPESPWWLVRRGRIDQAKKSVSRLTSRPVEECNRAVALIIHTNALEKEVESGVSYVDCFKNTDLRRTEIASLVFLFQSMCVGNVMSYGTYFFQQAGLPVEQSFNLGIGQYCIGLIGTFLAWAIMSRWGRRTIYFTGMVTIGVTFFVMGCVSLAPASNKAAPWVQSVLLFVVVFVYDCSIGCTTYTVISEISSSRLRGKTISIARNAFNIMSIINAIIYPYILNPGNGNWKGKVGFFQAGLCCICALWTFFRLPESKGRTYEELDVMFINRVPTRKFATYEVEIPDNIEIKRE